MNKRAAERAERAAIRAKLTTEKAAAKRTANLKGKFDLISHITHSSKIKRGHLYARVIYRHLCKKFTSRKILFEHPVTSPDIAFKKRKHKVDIIMFDDENRTILMVNSKSDGSSGTNPKADTIRVPLAAKEAIQREYPLYAVEHVVARPSGKAEYPEGAGIPTICTAELLLEGTDLEAEVKQEYYRIIQENVRKTLTEFCDDPVVAEEIRSFLDDPTMLDRALL